MRRGWVRYLAVGSGLAVLAYGAPAPVAAEGNAGLHIHKTVDPLRLTITPGIGVTLGVDKAAAIPGDTLNYTAVVTNPTATFGMGGDINAQAVASTDANVAYYWDELQYCAQGCGTGASDPHWTALAAFEAVQPGYQPVTPPAVHTGMSLAAVSVTRSGVTYPAGGDPILGTEISPSATAVWTYRSTIVLTPPQIALLGDPAQAAAIRNVLHFEITSRNTAAAQPYTDPEAFTNPFTSASNPGAISSVTVTFTLPDGTTTAVPAPAALNPGGSASVSAQFKVAVPTPRGTDEAETQYGTRLVGIDGSNLSATAVAAGSGFSGRIYATSPAVSTEENLPIVTIAKGGPSVVNAGDTETNPLSLQNAGGATASSLSVVDSVPSGGSGMVSGTPASLAPGASASASAAYPVPISQATGDLTDTAAVTWKDGNGNPYGSLSSSFTTQVHNILFGARLTLAPISAGPNAPGTTQALTATLVDSHGSPIAGQVVHFTVTGANATTGTGTTDANGNASFSYPGANTGNDVAQATLTAPGVTITSNTSAISWLRVLQPVVTTEVQGNFFANPANSCTFDAGPNSTPAFTQSFPDILFNPSASAVPHDISTVTNFTRPFTDLTVDINGNYNGQVVAQGNGQQAGAGSLINFYGVFTGNFVISQPGDLTFRILHDDGYIIGVGNGATRVSGDLEGSPPATTPFNGYGVVAAWNTSSTGSSSSGPATVHFPAAGTYPYELDYTECGAGSLFLDLLTEQFIAQTSPLSIYVGYADALRPGGSAFPFPWNGSPNTTFAGCSCSYDAGAIRFDNNSSSPMTFDSITVDIGANHFDLWPHGITLPPGQILVITETSDDNFDTSDLSASPCFTNNGVIPQINVTIGGATTSYPDNNQVLNTTGFDQACIHSETHPWENIAGSATAINLPLSPAVSLNLTPFNVPAAIQGQSLALTVSALDGAGNPAANLPVAIQVNGANSQTLNGTTDQAGLVTLSYSGAFAGADTVEASAFIGGLRSTSNVGSVIWISPGGTSSPLAPSISNPTPADGSVITKPVAVDAAVTPPSGHSITGWKVFYQPLSGGALVVIGSGAGAPPSPLGVTFDPTLVTDGAYRLTVQATADNGAVQDVSSGISVIGGLKLGRYKTSFQDLSVPVSGFQMQVLRSYDSFDTSSGDFGVGWRVDVSNFRVSSNHDLGAGGWTQYNKSCILGLCFTGFQNSAPRFITVVYPNQHSEIFDFVPGGGTNIFWSCTPVFKARTSMGSTSTLVPLDDTGCSYTGDGNIYGSSGVYNPQRFELTTRSGQVFILDHNRGLISVTDRKGNRLSIDSGGIHASSGQSIAYTRDGSGRITTIVGPSGQTLHYSYSAAGDLVSSTSPKGAVTTYTYDASHRLVQTTGPGGPLQTLHYDTSGRLTSITDGDGNTTQVSSNIAGQQDTVIDPSGRLTTVNTYDDLGDPIRIDRIAAGATLTTTMTYDAAGHLLSITNAGGGTTTATYDPVGEMTSLTDPAGITSHYSYDSLGDVTSATGPGGVVLVAMTFDASGNLLTLTDGGGNTTTYTYDSAGNVASRTDADGRINSYTYTSNGTLAGITTAAGSSTFTTDVSGRITAATNANGHTMNLTYDADGNLLSFADADGHMRSWTYDSLDRLMTSTDANAGHSSLVYDAAGNLTGITDANGMTVTRSYDADARLLAASALDGSSVSFAYDGFGRMVSAVSPAATLGFTYDARGYLLSQVTGGGQPANTLAYAYDADGRRTSSTGPDGTAAYGYGSQSNLASVTDTAGGVFKYGYDAALNLTSLQRPDGVVDTNTYDAMGRLLSRSSANGPTTLASATYSYTPAGERASRSDPGNTAAYQFDPVAQLLSVANSSAAVPGESYTYDAAGNRTSAGGAAVTYDSGGRMLSDGGTAFTYDAQGERISATDLSGNVTTYTWNAFHQLTGVTLPSGATVHYSYDALGRRVEVDQGSTAAHYTYDGQNLRLQYSGPTLAAAYTDPPVTASPLEMRQGSGAYYFLTDAQGSTVGLADQSGSLVATQRYDSFGKPLSSTGSVANSLSYLGQQYDSSTGLYFLNARYYDPGTGSFLSPDPLPKVNRYAYALNDPVDLSDPSGKAAGAEYEINIVTAEKNVVALDNATAPQTALQAQGTLREAVQASIEADADPLAAAGDQGDALALQLKVLMILLKRPLTIGVAVGIAFSVIGLTVTLIAYICSQVNDAAPDPSAPTGPQVASGARKGGAVNNLCAGLPGG